MPEVQSRSILEPVEEKLHGQLALNFAGGQYRAQVIGIPPECVVAQELPGGAGMRVRIERPAGIDPATHVHLSFFRTFQAVPAQSSKRGMMAYGECRLELSRPMSKPGRIQVKSAGEVHTIAIPVRPDHRESAMMFPFPHESNGDVSVEYSPVWCRADEMPECGEYSMVTMGVSERLSHRLVPGIQDAERVFLERAAARAEIAAALDDYREAQLALLARTRLQGSQLLLDPFIIALRDADELPHLPFVVGNVNAYHWYARSLNSGRSLYREFCETRHLPVPYIEKGEHVVDGGAHAGFYTLIYADIVGREGLVTAFDPFPQNNDMIHVNARINGFNQIVVAEGGLGATTHSSEVSNQRQKMTAEDNDRDVIEVKVWALDDAVQRPVDHLKLDVEGFEIEALRGAQRVLKEDRPKLYIEVHEQFYHYFDADIRELLDLLPDNYLYAQAYPNQAPIKGQKKALQPWEGPGLIVGVAQEKL